MAIKQYGWKDVSVIVLGRTIEGITDVKVKRTVTKERQYGRGSKTQAILSGNEEISGSLTLHQSELNAINQAVLSAATGLDITKVEFDIIINYENAAGLATTDAIIGAQVEEYEKALAQGDTQMAIELPFIARDLRENI